MDAIDTDLQILAEIQRMKICSRNATPSDSAFRILEAFAQGDAILERALEHIDNGSVTCISPVGGERKCFVVQSSLQTASKGRRYDATKQQEAANIPKEPYTVIIDGPGFCSCVDFTNRVLFGQLPRLRDEAAAASSRPPPPPDQHGCRRRFVSFSAVTS